MTQTATALEGVDEFRARARDWLAAHADELVDPGRDLRAQARGALTGLYDAGFGGITWPVEYGGLGLTRSHQDAFGRGAGEVPHGRGRRPRHPRDLRTDAVRLRQRGAEAAPHPAHAAR